jgi:tocopherol cyclase
VQAIEGRVGRTWWFEYPLGAFKASNRNLDIRVGANRFSAAGISLDLEGEGTRFRGELGYGELDLPPQRIGSPGVMRVDGVREVVLNPELVEDPGKLALFTVRI